MRSLAILMVVLLGAIPLYYMYGYLKKRVAPHQSFGRFFLFIFIILALGFAYTFLITLIIFKLFPLAVE